MSNMNSFFDELVHAKQAMERLPEAEAELARAQGEVQVMRDRFEAECKLAADLREIIAKQDAERSKMEAQLADATFRESDAKDKLAVLVGAFKAVNREINETVELVAPEPKPETLPELVAEISHDTAPVDEAPYNPINPVYPSDPPTDLPGNFVQGQGFEPIQEAPPTNIGWVHASEPTPIPTSSDSPSATTSENAQGSTTQENSPSTGDASYKPYAYRPYWHKPASVTWREWMAGGGDKAYWIDDEGNDSARLDP